MVATQIEAGPELDALVAIEVIGGYVHAHAGPGTVSPATAPAADGSRVVMDSAFPAQCYSTTYEGMGLVLERMQALGWYVQIKSVRDLQLDEWSWRVDLEPGHGWAEVQQCAPTLPHAVALAALAAVRANRIPANLPALGSEISAHTDQGGESRI